MLTQWSYGSASVHPQHASCSANTFKHIAELFLSCQCRDIHNSKKVLGAAVEPAAVAAASQGAANGTQLRAEKPGIQVASLAKTHLFTSHHL